MRRRSPSEIPYALARKIVVAIVGLTLLGAGILMLILPGPGLVVISLGLATLAVEFAWARRWLKQLKETAQSTMASMTQTSDDTPTTSDSATPTESTESTDAESTSRSKPT